MIFQHLVIILPGFFSTLKDQKGLSTIIDVSFFFCQTNGVHLALDSLHTPFKRAPIDDFVKDGDGLRS